MAKIIIFFKSHPKLIYILFPYLVLLSVYFLFLDYSHGPLIVADEFIQLSLARYFAGQIPITVVENPVAHFGYGLIISPFFRFFHNPDTVYHSILIFNVFLMTSIYFSLYYIIGFLFSADKKITALISFVSCLYPAYLIQTNYSWHENILSPLYLALVVLFIKFLEKQTYLRTFLLAIVTGFLYMVHFRMLLVVITIIFFLLILSFYKKIAWKKSISALVLIFFMILISSIIEKAAVANIWVNPISYSAKDLIFGLLSSIRDIKNLVVEIAGQIFFLIFSTLGIFILGIKFLFLKLIDKPGFKMKDLLDNNRSLAISFIFISSLAIFAVSILIFLFPLHSNVISLRLDHFFYGRYNEVFLPIYLAAGLFSIYKNKKPKFLYIYLFILYLLLIIYLGAEIDLVERVGSGVNVSGFFIVYFINHILSYFQILFLDNFIVNLALLFSLFLLIFSLLIKRNFLWGIIFLISIFAINFSVNKYDLSSNYIIDRDFLADLKAKSKKENISSISYDQVVGRKGYLAYPVCSRGDKNASYKGNRGSYYLYQFYIDNLNFNIFYSQNNESPKQKYVLASFCWLDAEKLGAKQVFLDNSNLLALWYLPEYEN